MSGIPRLHIGSALWRQVTTNRWVHIACTCGWRSEEFLDESKAWTTHRLHVQEVGQ